MFPPQTDLASMPLVTPACLMSPQGPIPAYHVIHPHTTPAPAAAPVPSSALQDLRDLSVVESSCQNDGGWSTLFTGGFLAAIVGGFIYWRMNKKQDRLEDTIDELEQELSARISRQRKLKKKSSRRGLPTHQQFDQLDNQQESYHVTGYAIMPPY